MTRKRYARYVLFYFLLVILVFLANRLMPITSADEPGYTIPAADHIMSDGQRVKIVGVFNRGGGGLEPNGPRREDKMVMTELDQKFFVNWKGEAYLLIGSDSPPLEAVHGACIEFKNLEYREVNC